MFHDWGNAPIKSTTVSATDPSTSTLIAEIDSTQFGQVSTRALGYRVFWRAGASTGGIFLLEHALSTGLGSTAVRNVSMVFTGANQTAQFLDTYQIEPGDRLRVRSAAAGLTGTFSAQISAEPMT